MSAIGVEAAPQRFPAEPLDLHDVVSVEEKRDDSQNNQGGARSEV